MRRIVTGLLACAALGCATPKHLARVNDDVVDAQDLKAEFVRRHGGHQRFLAADDYIVRRFLDATVDRRLLLQEAYRLGLHEEPDIREAARELELRKVAERFVKLEVNGKIVVTDAEVDEAYAAKTEDLYLVRHVVVATRAEADSLRAELAAGKDFEAAARERSLAESRKFGGLLPEVAWGARTPEWEAAVFALEPKGIAGPFEAEDGFELVQLESKRKAKKPDEDKALPRIRMVLTQRKLDARRRELVAELRAKHQAVVEPVAADVEVLRAALAAKDARPIATWSGGKLTLGELAASLDLDALARLPRHRVKRAVNAELETAVNDRVVKAEAATRGHEAEPEIARAVRDQRESLMENRLYGSLVFREIKVTEADVKAWYDAHQAELVVPERRHVAHVLAESEEGAQEVLRAIKQGTPFEELARTQSADVAAAKSAGDLGWITRKEAPGELARVFEVGAGELVGPVKSKFGHHVVKVLEIAPARTPPLEEVAAEVRKKATREKNQERRDAWVKELRRNARISVSERAVKAFVETEKAQLASTGGMPAPPSHAPSEPGSQGGMGHGAGAPGHGAGGPSPAMPHAMPSGVQRESAAVTAPRAL